MKKRQNLIVTMGIPSLFLIFSVLVVVILSLLSLNTSRSDVRTSEISLEQTENYYEACGEAADFCGEAADFLTEAAADAADTDDFYSEAGEYFSSIENVVWDAEEHLAVFETDFSDSQALSVTISVSAPGNASSCMEITAWNTVSTGNWESLETQPVYRTAQ